MAIASLPPDGTAGFIAPNHSLSAADLLSWRRAMLALEGFAPASAADLDWLLDLGGGVRWSTLQSLLLDPSRSVRLARPLGELEQLWRRHRRGSEPLQYLLGLCPWRDLELAVGPSVLIPRQETEQLAELALQMAPPPGASPLLWADLGTGSGCLAVALARGLPGSRGLAVDASGEALGQAAANLRSLLPVGTLVACVDDPAPALAGGGPQVARLAGAGTMEMSAVAETPARSRVSLRQGSWWQAIVPWWGRLDLVVSNPPYIPSAVVDALDPVVRDHEPRLALDGGADGLAAIRTIVAGAAVGLAPGGLLLLEHHHDQSEAVLALLNQAGLGDCRAHRDLEGVRRFASARRAPAAPVKAVPQEAAVPQETALLHARTVPEDIAVPHGTAVPSGMAVPAGMAVSLAMAVSPVMDGSFSTDGPTSTAVAIASAAAAAGSGGEEPS